MSTYIVWAIPQWMYLPDSPRYEVGGRPIHFVTEEDALAELELRVRAAAAEKAETLAHTGSPSSWYDGDGHFVQRWDGWDRLRATDTEWRVVGEPRVYREGNEVCVELRGQRRWLRMERRRVEVEGQVYESPKPVAVPVSDWMPEEPPLTTLRMGVAEELLRLDGDLGFITEKLEAP